MKVLIRVPQLVSCSLNVNFSFFVLTLSQPFFMLYLNPFSLHAFSQPFYISAGYNFYGNERMYNGVDGRELEVDIFMGVVYYQRLRHMVSDKFQVRTTGPIDILTHQPVKGRKRAGGIRFGEMERDSLLAHGSSFILQDRLLNCSDRSFVSMQGRCMGSGCI